MRRPSVVGFDRYEPGEEPRRESILGLGNGVLFVRAAAPEGAFAEDGEFRARHHAGLYVAGGYDRAVRIVAGEPVEISALARLPDPFGLGFRVEGEAGWFSADGNEILAYRHELDLRAGLARRDMTVRDAAGRTTRLREIRLVSMRRAGLAMVLWRVTPLDWSGEAEVRALLQTHAANTKVERLQAYGGQHVRAHPIEVEDGLAVAVSSCDGARRWAIRSRLRCIDDLGEQEGQRTAPLRSALAQTCRVPMRAGATSTACLLVEVHEGDLPRSPAPFPQVVHLLREQRRVWRLLLRDARIHIPGDSDLERGCAFDRFHLLQTASPLSARRDIGLPARGWQEAYLGHVFWDELFAAPFYALRHPGIARALLLYRSRRLGAACEAARAIGHHGAMYPWRSSDTGREETPPWQWIPPARRWKRDHTHLQRHIGAAIARNVLDHHLATGDSELLVEHTGPMLVGIARFFCSLAQRGEDGRLGIRGVVGPDEYHDRLPGAAQPGLDDNAYTNVMVAWTLQCAAELPRWITTEEWKRLCATAGVHAREPGQWDETSRRLRVRFLPGDVVCQFDGYETLLPPDNAGLPPDGEPMRTDWWLLARGDDANRYQRGKQADVLMLFHLLGSDGVQRLLEHLDYRPAPGWQRRTVDFYLPRVAGESSLSAVACAGALAGFDADASWTWFRRALHVDYGPDASPSTHEGLHLAAMAGAQDVLQRHYLGVHLVADGIDLRPRPPAQLERVDLRLCWRGRQLALALDGPRLAVRHAGGDGIVPLHHAGERIELGPGRAFEVRVR